MKKTRKHPKMDCCRRLRLLPLRCFVAFALYACVGGEAVPGTGDTHIDSLRELELTENLRLGSTTDLGTGFTAISGLKVDREGLLYVFEGSEFQIRVYSPEGVLLRRIGGKGEGPGEFSERNVRFGVHGDTVWTISGISRDPTLALFDRTTGSLLSSARVERVTIAAHAPGGSILILPEYMDDDGLFVGNRSLNIGAPGGGRAPRDSIRDTVSVPRVRFSAQGKVVDTAGSYPYPYYDAKNKFVTAGSGKYLVPRAAYSDPITLTLRSSVLLVDRYPPQSTSAAVFHVTATGARNDTLFRRGFRYAPVQIPSAELDSAAAREARSNGTMALFSNAGMETLTRTASDSLVAKPAIRAAMDWPRFRVPVSDTHIGADDSVWLLHGGVAESDSRWIVLDANGLPMGRIALPPRTTVYWSNASTVWAVQRDSLDVPFLVRFSMR